MRLYKKTRRLNRDHHFLVLHLRVLLSDIYLSFVSFDSISLILDTFALEFFSRLSHPELISRQLGSIHPIHELFFGINSFTSFDRIRSKSSVEPFVPCIMEDPEHFVLDTSIASCSREGFEILRCLLPQP